MTIDKLRSWHRQRRLAMAEARRKRLAVLDSRFVIPVWAWFAVLFVLGAAVRIISVHKAQGLYHPDEISQYLEPAHRLLERHGIVTWEFKSGGRSWFVAWYCAALLQVARWLGDSGFARVEFVRLADALVSLVAVPAAFRMAKAINGRIESGVLAAAMTALAPTLGYFGCAIMAEWHSFIFLSWAYAIWLEQAQSTQDAASRRGAVAVGLLLGGAFVARPNFGVVVPLVAADYLLRRRYRDLFSLGIGVSISVAALGIADWITWGAPFQSIIVWFDFNIIQGRGAASNIHPFDYYFREVLYNDYGPALAVIVVSMMLSIRKTWRSVLGWLWPLVVMTLLTNKQERFVLPVWPCFLACAAASLVEVREFLTDRFPSISRSKLKYGVFAALPALVLVAALVKNTFAANRKNWREKSALLQAQDWTRKHRDLTGLAITGRWYRSGAYTVTDRHVPLVFDQNDLPTARVYSHLITIGDTFARARRSPDWKLLGRFGRYGVFRRVDAWIDPEIR